MHFSDGLQSGVGPLQLGTDHSTAARATASGNHQEKLLGPSQTSKPLPGNDLSTHAPTMILRNAGVRHGK